MYKCVCACVCMCSICFCLFQIVATSNDFCRARRPCVPLSACRRPALFHHPYLLQLHFPPFAFIHLSSLSSGLEVLFRSLFDLPLLRVSSSFLLHFALCRCSRLSRPRLHPSVVLLYVFLSSFPLSSSDVLLDIFFANSASSKNGFFDYYFFH